jgi:Tfp pilus assembly protein PilN
LAITLARLTDTPDQWLLINVGQKHCSIIAVIENHICLIRTLPIGNQKNLAEWLANQIQWTISAFRDHFQFDFQPEQLFLDAFDPLHGKLDSQITEILRLPVQAVDLLNQIKTMDIHPLIDETFSAPVDQALALALSQVKGLPLFNFRRGPFVIRTRWSEYKTDLIKVGVSAAVALILGLFYIFADSSITTQKVKHLDTQITSIFTATFPDQTARNADYAYKQMQANVRVAINETAIAQEQKEYIKRINILNEISQKITSSNDVQLTELNISDDEIQITGTAKELNIPDEIKTSLEKTSLFQRVELSSANRDRKQDHINFKLRIEL